MINYYDICNNCRYVDQSEIIISNKKLRTSHLGTCSVLAFSFNNLNFMAHVDALQNTKEQLLKKIKKKFDIKNIRLKKVYIVSGAWCNTKCDTIRIIMNVLKQLNIELIIHNKNIKWKNIIDIDQNNISIT